MSWIVGIGFEEFFYRYGLGNQFRSAADMRNRHLMRVARALTGE